MDQHPKEKEAFFRKILGDKEYDDLEALSREHYRGWKKDAPEIAKFYKEAFRKELVSCKELYENN